MTLLNEKLRALGELLTPFHLDWIQVEVSARCGGRCRYCPVGRFGDRRRNALMAMELFERLEPSFSSADLVFLQGWGEPLLHPRFWEMVRRVRRAKSRVGFTTNGVLLDEANRAAMLESGVDVVGVSVAGGAPETHDRFRAGNPLGLIDLNLRRLRAEKAEAGSPLPEIHMAYLLLTGNVGELDAAVDRAEAWGATDIVVSHLSLVLDASLESESLLACPDGWAHAESHLREARTRAWQRGIRLSYRVPAREKAVGECGENVLRSCFVSALGDVSPCVMTNLGLEVGAVHWFGGREETLETLTFGNVRDWSIAEIWRSEVAREFRAAFGRPGHEGARWAAGSGTRTCEHCYKRCEGPSAELP